jgi:hypothetical protein
MLFRRAFSAFELQPGLVSTPQRFFAHKGLYENRARFSRNLVPTDGRGVPTLLINNSESNRIKPNQIVPQDCSTPAELIRGFVPPVPGQVIVLADSTFCGAPVIRAAPERGFAVIGWIKKNQRLADGRDSRGFQNCSTPAPALFSWG